MKNRFRKTAGLLGAALFLGTGVAHAALIDFDAGLDTSQAPWSPLLSQGASLYQSGYAISTASMTPGADPDAFVGLLVDGRDVAGTCFGMVCPTDNSSNFLMAMNDSAVYLTEQSNSGVPFLLSGFKASFVGNGIDPLPASGGAGVLRVLEMHTDGSVTTESFELASINSNGDLNFASFNSTNSKPVVAAMFFAYFCDTNGNCSDAFSNNKAQFALDDINVSAVPEPATWAMTALGLAGVAGVARRRSRTRANPA